MLCPCGTQLELEHCCGPFLKGAPPPTAEALMRSRYTAYVLGDIDYILRTHLAKEGDEVDREATEKFSKESEWQGLQIVATERGGPEDSDGVVEFIARYKAGGADQTHHERSTFKKVDDRWLFADGTQIKAAPVRRADKPGRNDACPCGSGKKYKRCHGA